MDGIYSVKNICIKLIVKIINLISCAGYLASREKYIRAFQALEHKEIISIKIGSFPGEKRSRTY